MNKLKNLNLAVFGKLIVGAAGAAAMALQPYYGGQHWFAAVVAALAFIGVGTSESHSGPGAA